MLPSRAVRPFGSSLLAAAALLTCLAAPAAAQDANPNGGALTLSGALDFTNAYMFRGIKQESDGFIMWPYLDLGATLYKGEGSVKSFGINVGTWNSLHALNDTGTDNPRNHKMWYESDFYTSLSFTLNGGVTSGVTYTAYTSPNDGFTTVKELAFKVSVDDSKQLKSFSLKPYGLIASELDTSTGTGQADGGAKAGVYVELGIAPSFTLPAAVPQSTLSVPVKVGLSMKNYYEKVQVGGGDDSTFGFASVAGVLTHQLSKKPTKLGNWNVHVGVEYQRLGDTTKLFLNEVKGEHDPNTPVLPNDLKAYKFIYSGGLGFSY